MPFDAVHVTNKNNNKWYLVMNATKDELKRATGFTYQRKSRQLGSRKRSKAAGNPVIRLVVDTRSRFDVVRVKAQPIGVL